MPKYLFAHVEMTVQTRLIVVDADNEQLARVIATVGPFSKIREKENVTVLGESSSDYLIDTRVVPLPLELVKLELVEP